jgi:AcrR family transcriptional regulator
MSAKLGKRPHPAPLKGGLLKVQRRLQSKNNVGFPTQEFREMRSDGVRNVEKLLQAAEAIAISGKDLSMQAIAKVAGVGLATAYRHFTGVEDLLEEYSVQLTNQLLEVSLKANGGGREMLYQISHRWVELAAVHGVALVAMAPKTGTLLRMRAGTRYAEGMRNALLPALREILRELGQPVTRRLEEESLMLWGALFAAREVADLIMLAGFDQERATRHLVGAYCGAIQGWTEVPLVLSRTRGTAGAKRLASSKSRQ